MQRVPSVGVGNARGLFRGVSERKFSKRCFDAILTARVSDFETVVFFILLLSLGAVTNEILRTNL